VDENGNDLQVIGTAIHRQWALQIRLYVEILRRMPESGEGGRRILDMINIIVVD
jgi:hypothetical protein